MLDACAGRILFNKFERFKKFKRLNAVLNKHFKPIEHIEPIEPFKIPISHKPDSVIPKFGTVIIYLAASLLIQSCCLPFNASVA